MEDIGTIYGSRFICEQLNRTGPMFTSEGFFYQISLNIMELGFRRLSVCLVSGPRTLESQNYKFCLLFLP